MQSQNNNFINCDQIITDVSDLLWFEPRKMANKLVPYINNREDQLKYGVEYYFGMLPELHAYICGLIKRHKPKKILEVGVFHGASSVVYLQAIKTLNLDAKLYSVDIANDTPAASNVQRWAPHLIEKWNLHYGRDVSAYLDEIGGGIDFCILDTAHYMPGEVLNFLCVLPYLKDGAIVVIDDQIAQFRLISDFVREIGSESMISCKVLFDIVVAEKLTPNLSKNDIAEPPNIGSFTVSEKTRKNVNSLFSALLLPWRFMPSRQHLTDVYISLAKNYPSHVLEYFTNVTEQQINFHSDISNVNQRARVYWNTLMNDCRSENDKIAFYGGGQYCKKIIEEWLAKPMFPALIFDSACAAKTSFGEIPVYNSKELSMRTKSLTKIVITSSAFHVSIERSLTQQMSDMRIDIEIINPFKFPNFGSHWASSVIS